MFMLVCFCVRITLVPGRPTVLPLSSHSPHPTKPKLSISNDKIEKTKVHARSESVWFLNNPD